MSNDLYFFGLNIFPRAISSRLFRYNYEEIKIKLITTFFQSFDFSCKSKRKIHFFSTIIIDSICLKTYSSIAVFPYCD